MPDPSDSDADSLPTARKRPAVATSLAAARPSEIIYTSRGGQVLPPGRVRWLKLRSWAVMGACLVAVGTVYGALISPVAGAVAALAIGALLTWRLRPSLAMRDAAALSSAGRWEEAHAALTKLAGGSMPPGLRPTLGVLLAATSSLLGRPEESLRHLDAIKIPFAARLAARTMVAKVQVASLRANALARLDRATEARAERARLRELLAEIRARNPGRRAEVFELFLQGTELTVAARFRAPEELPDTETLHQWAREALARSRFGEMLVALAWAFDQRGDQEMARHLLSEASSRVNRWALPANAGHLWGWAEEKRIAWGLPPFLAGSAD